MYYEQSSDQIHQFTFFITNAHAVELFASKLEHIVADQTAQHPMLLLIDISRTGDIPIVSLIQAIRQVEKRLGGLAFQHMAVAFVVKYPPVAGTFASFLRGKLSLRVFGSTQHDNAAAWLQQHAQTAA